MNHFAVLLFSTPVSKIPFLATPVALRISIALPPSQDDGLSRNPAQDTLAMDMLPKLVQCSRDKKSEERLRLGRSLRSSHYRIRISKSCS